MLNTNYRRQSFKFGVFIFKFKCVIFNICDVDDCSSSMRLLAHFGSGDNCKLNTWKEAVL